MTKAVCVCGIVSLMTAPALAGAGDSWILPIHHRNGSGWTERPNAGYAGTSAWEAYGMDATRRIYWELSGTGVPGTTELYRIEFFVPTQGRGDWQPIESQFNGVDGEAWPFEPNIPWVGAFGNNHQYIGSDFPSGTGGTWRSTGPGPHTPEGEAYNAGPNGTYMWLTHGSWLYAKWDFTWNIGRSWSALRVTQITPEPASLTWLALGALTLLRRRPPGAHAR